MKWSFHPEAETEFHEAIDYYEECESGLGADFAIEVHATIQNILATLKRGRHRIVISVAVLPADFHMVCSTASKPREYLSSP